MATTIAQISPFDIDNDNFVECEERFSSFSIANGITDKGKKKAILEKKRKKYWGGGGL